MNMPGNDFLDSTGNPVGPTHLDLMQQAQTSTYDAFDASMQLAQKETIFGSLDRMQKRREMDQIGEKMQPDELKKNFPEVADKINEPMTWAAAAYIHQSQKERHQLEDVINRAPNTWSKTGANFAGGLLAHMTDPAELAIMVGTMGAAAELGIAAKGTQLAVQAGLRPGLASIAGSAGAFFAENAAMQAPVEAMNAFAAPSDGTKYDFASSAEHFLKGTGYFFAGGLALKGLAKGIRWGGNAALEKLGPKVSDPLGNMVKNQAALGTEINVKPAVDMMLHETGGDGTHVHVPITEPGQISERQFHAATPTNVADLAEGKPHVFGDDFGGELTLTEDRSAANGAAAMSHNPVDGTVFSGKVSPEAKLFDLDAPIPEDIKSLVNSVTELVPEDPKVAETMTMRDVMTSIREAEVAGDIEAGTLDAVNSKLKEAGYDGFYHDNRFELGADRDPKNTVVLYDKSKFITEKAGTADRASVPQMSPEQFKAKATEAYGNDRYASPEAEQKLQEHMQNPIGEVQVDQELTKQLDEQHKQLKELEAQGDADAAKILEQDKELARTQRRKQQAFKAMAECMIKRIG